MSNPFEKPVVVIDNGSYNIKAGFACDNHPVSIFRTVVGRPKYLNGRYGKTPYEVYVGDDALEHLDDLELSYPVVKGKITHWDNMERVWHHVYYRELRAAPEDRAVLLSCAPATTIEDKTKCCEIFFESLNAPALCVKPQSVLALFGSGFTTGLSVDLGDHITAINPVYEGGSISYANMETNVAGDDVTNFMKDSFEKRGVHLGRYADDVLEDLKTNYLYVTKHGAVSREEYFTNYKLPSGEVIDVSEETYMCGEMYFQPELVMGQKPDILSLQEAIVTAVLKCDSGLQSEMYDVVVTHGGIATMRGLDKRLSREIETIVRRPVKARSSLEPYALAWLGGAVFAGMVDARKVWVHKKQFEEHGERIVRNRIKCCEIFFECLNAPALCVKPQSFLALFGAGSTTGLSVDLGEDITEINPIYEGGSITYANMLTNVAGCDVKQFLTESLQKRGYDLEEEFGSQASDKIMNDLWNMLYITQNRAVTREQYKKDYTLPNGKVIDVSDEVFFAAELFFSPKEILGENMDKLSLQEAMVTSILKIDDELQTEMLESIVVHGGRLTIAGFNKRLAREMQEIMNRPVQIPVLAEPYAVAWMGGSVFANMAGAPRLWVLKKQYEEHGERFVRNRFL